MDTKLESQGTAGSIPAILVTVEEAGAQPASHRFTKPFRIGRESDCQIILKDALVSRVHAEGSFEGGRWILRDLQSMNGIYQGGMKIPRVPIEGKVKVTLGVNGPLLTLQVEGMETSDKTMPVEAGSISRYIHHYFEEKDAVPAGQHTVMVRRAFRQIEKVQSRKYIRIIIGISILLVGAASYAIYKHEQLRKQEALAQQVFYEMKELELAFARLQGQIDTKGDMTAQAQVESYMTKQKELNTTYDKYIGELGVYTEGMDEKQRLIYRVARIFGECEIGVPEGFVGEVENYIGLWKLSDRLSKSVGRARERGYIPMISGAMLGQHMPPQFFYLALQESEFDSTTVGPPTRFGIAKGMWQFIPATALRYGLRTGPLVHLARTDPRDERHNAGKSTLAAAQYLRDIYKTEAQASGLLVIASYNWGHNIVRGLIKELPENPRERNFWQFLKIHRDKIPKQTYDYVYYIFSAAVIGENPGLFGFKFERPLESPAQ